MTATPLPIIAYVASPLHVLSALAAVKTFHPNDRVSVTLVVNYPTADATLLAELHGIVEVMTEGLPLVTSCVAISTETIKHLIGRTDVNVAASEFRALLEFGDPSEIYYFHDVMGSLVSMLAQAYPSARRICFGDCLGIAYERRYHLSRLGIDVPRSVATRDPTTETRSLLSRLWPTLPGQSRRNEEFADLSKLPYGSPSLIPHAAALILPIDESGDFLRGVQLKVVSKNLVLQLLNELVSRCSSFRQYEESLLAEREAARKFLLLTECNAEGQFLPFERDVEMYCAIIETHCEPGSIVYLKSHPAESVPRNEGIRTRIGTKFELIEFDNRFKRYPIEFAAKLVRESTPICMTYPRLSLKYLYDVDVIQPMDGAFIERWFSQKHWEFFRNGHAMMERPRQRLENWNGDGLLWNGRWNERSDTEITR